MSSIGTGYDLSATTFSPAGRVFQVEYADKAVENSGTAVGLRGKDCVVFAVEKLVKSKLHEPGCNRRTHTVDRHIGVCIAGLIGDGRALVREARSEANQYLSFYGTPISTATLNDRLSQYMHAYTLYGGARPNGCCMLIGGYEKSRGPELFLAEPSGIAWGYYGCAVGKAKQNAQAELEKLKLSELSGPELVKEAARIIYKVHDPVKDKEFELEMSWVGADSDGKHQSVPKTLFDEAEGLAKAALEDDDDDDDDEDEDEDMA